MPSSSEKRKVSPNPPTGGALVKRTKADEQDSKAITRSSERSKDKNAIIGNIKRTSGLEAPVMCLGGHEGAILSCEFDKTGEHLASGSFDRQIFLWNTYGDCKNYGVLRGHTNAVLELHWSRDSSQIFSCSADETVAVWDTTTGERVRRWKGHNGVVNSCQVAHREPELVVSGSDDRTVRLWDRREKEAVKKLSDKYQVTSVCFSEADDMVYTAGIDNEIKVWDLRKMGVQYTLPHHTDTITGLSLNADGSYLLSRSMDHTVRMWDVKPFAAEDRCVNVFYGASNRFEENNLIRPCWSTDGSQIACGSGDRNVVIWEVSTAKILYKLPGHKGSVNDVDWHPKEPIIMSCSDDKNLFLGEVKSTNDFQ